MNQNTEDAPLRSVPKEGYSASLWRERALPVIREGFQEKKAKLGGQYTQAMLTEAVSKDVGQEIRLTLMNNWLNGRQIPPEDVAFIIAARVSRREKFAELFEARPQQPVTIDDIRTVLSKLKMAPGVVEKHGYNYDTVFDIAYSVASKAMREKKAIAGLSKESILDMLYSLT